MILDVLEDWLAIIISSYFFRNVRKCKISFLKLYQKIMHKKFEAEIQNFDTGVCRKGYASSNIKKSKLSSFKTLGRVRSGSLKDDFLGRKRRAPLKVLHAVRACKIIYATL